jgi:hypothetical protein
MQLLVDKRAPTPPTGAPNAEASANDATAGVTPASERFTILVLKSNQEIEVTKYKRDGDLLMFKNTRGQTGSVGVNDVDWRKTSEMTAEVRSVDSPTAALPIN